MTLPIEARIIAEDPRYPTLVIVGPWGTHGYDLDPETGDIRRVCICHARSSTECVCGDWEAREK